MAHTYLFPLSYGPWLASRLPAPPTETLATCHSCVMIHPEKIQGPRRDPGPFLAGLKCCTYFPFLPNFTLGKLTPASLKLALDAGGVFLPIGLYPSQGYQQLKRQLGSQGFGLRSELLCPFYDSQTPGCSIWKFRPGVCTSYFCLSDRGQQGLDFWSQMEKYLNHFEWILARELLHRLGLGENELAFCQAAVSADTEAEERDIFIQSAWGSWWGRQEEFYQQASVKALEISAQDLDQLLEPPFLEFENQLKKSWSRI